MTSKFILLAGLFAFITAEFSFAQNTPTPTATVEPDPIKSFKELVTRFPRQQGIRVSPTIAYDIGDVTFDVKKTDSIINPVIGIINFTQDITNTYTSPVIRGAPDQSKKVHSFHTRLHLQMVFDWQGDHWTLERILNRKNGVDFTRGYLTEPGPISDFLKSLQ
jgi:hypothetical protein